MTTDKSTHFFGASVFVQLISLIDGNFYCFFGRKYQSEHYIKRFTTEYHLVSILFCTFAKCSSLRESSGAMLGLSGKKRTF
ncbi:MAG: DUF4372 domain-containing protein [Cytophagaceae bacterium]|nr:DUF4372 domain-containing protein [Cytophagaceae bacterium]